jgi:hypothetical protein
VSSTESIEQALVALSASTHSDAAIATRRLVR